jgi:MoxR-like ATPase
VAQISQQNLLQARDAVLDIHLDDSLEDYIIEIVLATRDASRYGEELAGWIQHGASPRATMALDRCARAYAWLNNRDYVVPEDIQLLAPDVLRHRIILSFAAEAEGMTADSCIAAILSRVAVP